MNIIINLATAAFISRDTTYNGQKAVTR